MTSPGSLRLIILLCIAVLALGSETANTQSTQVRGGSSAAIDETSRIVLKGNRHPLAVAANDRGEAAPSLAMERMLLVLKRTPDQEAQLQRFIAEQQDKTSANFHGWLSPEQFAQRFGTAKSDQQTASMWLQSHGFHINRLARGGMAIEFGGTAAQVKEGFGTAIHQYVVNGKQHYANSEEPQLPAALASRVEGISTLHNFEKHPYVRTMGTATRIGDTSSWQPNFTFNNSFGPFHYLAPGDFAKIYNASPLYSAGLDGTNQTIAVVGRSNINLSDTQIFRLAFGLPANDPVVVLDGPDPGNLFGDEETEADLDVEWSGAIAPKATIQLVVSATTNTTDGVDLSAQYIVDNNLAPILSISFGQCESSMGATESTFYNNLWEQAAAQGITVVVSSGDNGAAGCDNPNFGILANRGLAVNGIASTPFNVAVGGTQFNENNGNYWAAVNGPGQSSALSYIPEQVWNESCPDGEQCGFISLFASGGGVSTLYPKPPWQVGPGVPVGGNRNIPDVSLNAAGLHDGYLLCQEGACLTDSRGELISALVVGGTSASTPAFAGIMALLLQKTGSRQGQANFVLYPLAAGQNAVNCNASTGPQSQCVFNDITQGNNSVPGQAGFSAAPGYDLATGLGSVNAGNLVNSWQNQTNNLHSTSSALQLSSRSFPHGQPVTATATVTAAPGSGTPTGNIALLTGGSGDVSLGTLVNGSVSSSISTLPGGTYSLSAIYGGDGTFAASTSPGVPVSITQESSATTFSTLAPLSQDLFGLGPLVPATSTTYSNFFFLQAGVAGASGQGIATGTISFSDTFNGNTSTLMTVPLNSQGNVLVRETSLAIGPHTLTATYSGDASFSASTGASNVTISKGITETVLLLPLGVPPNIPVTLPARVSARGTGGPTGTVQFFSGNTALGNVALQNGVARLTTNQLTLGNNSITAVYSGDANFNGSTSPASTIFVGNHDFQISVNPGNVTVSSSAPGNSTVEITPTPGFGFSGTLSFSCSGLPTGAVCSFAPGQLNVNGFAATSTTLSISKTSAGAVLLPNVWQDGRLRFVSVATLSALCILLLICWATGTMRRRLGVMAFAACALFAVIGCGGGSRVSATTSSVGTNNAVVTVTATGTSLFQGNAPVTHTVTLAVTIQ